MTETRGQNKNANKQSYTKVWRFFFVVVLFLFFVCSMTLFQQHSSSILDQPKALPKRGTNYMPASLSFPQFTKQWPILRGNAGWLRRVSGRKEGQTDGKQDDIMVQQRRYGGKAETAESSVERELRLMLGYRCPVERWFKVNLSLELGEWKFNINWKFT